MLLLCAISQAQVRFMYLVLTNILNNPKLELTLISLILGTAQWPATWRRPNSEKGEVE